MTGPPTYRLRAEEACRELQQRAWADGYRDGLAVAGRIHEWLTVRPDATRRRWADAALKEARGRLPAPTAAPSTELPRRPAAGPLLDEPAAQVLSVSSRAYRVLDDRLPCALWGDTTERAVTVRELCACTELDLFKLRGCGVTTLRGIKAALAEHGLALAGEPLWGLR